MASQAPLDRAAAATDVLGVSPGTVKSRCARGGARLLPHVAHLRESGQVPGQTRNQPAAGHVSPSPGLRPAPTAAPTAAGPGRRPARERGRAGLHRRASRPRSR